MSDDRPGPILVTGANSGIGLATALHLAGRGWTVYGTARTEEKAAQLRRRAGERDVARQVHALILDVSDDQAVTETWRDLPNFYGVVNNAGYAESGAVEEVSAEQIRRQLDVNLIAPAVISSCALPGMRRRGEGRIVMVSSIAGRAAFLPLNAWYHASKFGLEALSDVLRVEVASFGVRVVIVEPGFFRTNIEEKARQQTGSRLRGDSPYAAAYERMERMLGWVERMAPEPDAVARTIATAIESRRPRQRYLVGLDALATAATQPFTPRELTDFAMQLVGGLTGRDRKSS